jgi:hypothetical protein
VYATGDTDGVLDAVTCSGTSIIPGGAHVGDVLVLAHGTPVESVAYVSRMPTIPSDVVVPQVIERRGGLGPAEFAGGVMALAIAFVVVRFTRRGAR